MPTCHQPTRFITWSILSGPAGATGDLFGRSVDVFKDYAIVGAPGDDAMGADGGMVHVFQRAGNVWVHVTRLAGADTAAGDALGPSVAISGNTLIAGAPGQEFLPNIPTTFHPKGSAATARPILMRSPGMQTTRPLERAARTPR